MSDTLDPARAAWYDREAELVDSAVAMIRVYQYKMPDGIGPLRGYGAPWPQNWWDAFWDRLESEAVLEQREVFCRRWRERHQAGGRQTTLDSVARRDPALCPYIRHGQQELGDFGGEVDA